MRRTAKLVGATAFATALIVGPALPAMAEVHEHPVGPELLVDGYPPSGPPTTAGWWYREATANGGTAELYKGSDAGAISPSGPPGFGSGALALKTTANDASKAQLLSPHHTYTHALTELGTISYWTYLDNTSEPNTAGAKQILPALHLQVDTNGPASTGGVTTLVFEPYQETPAGASQTITPETWQQWDATMKQWWSTDAVHCAGGAENPFDLAAGAGGAPFTTLAEVTANCPGATIIQFGVNVGATPTDNIVAAVDGLTIGIGPQDVVFDFGPK
jgi:hypothetical protein